MRISDWSSDVCSSDLRPASSAALTVIAPGRMMALARVHERFSLSVRKTHFRVVTPFSCFARFVSTRMPTLFFCIAGSKRSEEHTSELQSLMRISYAVFCLKNKIQSTTHHNPHSHHPP